VSADPTLIAVDAGTTGVTVLLCDARLEVLARAERDFAQSFPRPGWVEHEPRALLGALDECLEDVARHPRARHARALGVANQRETVFALERSSGRALGPGIVWQDRRTSERCAELRAAGRADWIGARTGLVLDPYFSASKIEWMLREHAELAQGARAGSVAFGTVDALVLAHLTRGRSLCTEATNASRTMLFDIVSRQWDHELCELFGVRADWLPRVLPSSARFGECDHPSLPHGLPVHGMAGDQQSALFGQGCTRAGDLKITYGTGCFLLLHTGGTRVRSSSGLLTTLALEADGSIGYAQEGSVFSGGALIQFLRDQLGLFATAADSERLARSVPDSGGVHVVPAFTGLGAPYWAPEARAAILGLTRGSTPAHIARAALEAIAWQCAELVELLRAESGLESLAVRVDGGAAANDLLLQLQADAAQVRVVRAAELEATARGAAALAGLGCGLWPAVPSAGESRASFEPQLAPAQRAQRMAAWRAAVRRVL
jgi:glycerol kinase